MKPLFIFFSLFLYGGFVLHSQNHYWQITLNDGREISTKSLQLSGDSVVIDSRKKISISFISNINMRNNSPFMNGAGRGFIIGVTLGAVIAFVSYEKPKGQCSDIEDFPYGGREIECPGPGGGIALAGFLGGFLGFLTGGLVGVLSDGENFKLVDMIHEKKLNTIQQLVDGEQNSPRFTFAGEWKVVEFVFSDIIQETDSGFEIRVGDKTVSLKKSELKIVRRTHNSIVLALPTKLYDGIFEK